MEVDDRFTELSPPTCVVLGGRSFVGRSLVLRLLKLGKWIVRVADSAPSLHLDPSEHDSLLFLSLSSARASYVHVDVRNKSQIVKAVEGSSAVFYTDYSDLPLEDFSLCYMVIVQGAKNVISACQECKVKRLIYSSSADVVFSGSHDIHNGDESLAYPWKFEDMMRDLKSQAEALVLSANNIDGLLTCALRPSHVFGPEDMWLVPFLVNLSKSRLAKFILGNGENMSDFTYVENVSHANIRAEEALEYQSVSVAGKAFFITNLEPMKFWEFMSLIEKGLGHERPSRKLPSRMVHYILCMVKWIHGNLGLNRYNHSVSIQHIQLASCTRTFNCTAAKKQIGYSPIVSIEEGVKLTIESFSYLGKETSSVIYRNINEQSKVDKLLGSGKVADVLLWREERISFASFVALVLLFYWFFLCGRSFTASVTKLLLLITLILYGYVSVPTKIFGPTVLRLSSSSFQISESVIKDSIGTLAYLWNDAFRSVRSLAQGEDWSIFFKVAALLYIFKLIFSQSLNLVIGVALVLAFTAFFVYEQYEAEIDGLANFLLHVTKKLTAVLQKKLPVSVTSFLHNFQTLHQGKETNSH